MAWFQVRFFSECLTRIVPLHVLIPADASDRPPGRGDIYKTLYLLHGYSGDCSDWLLMGQAQELSQRYDLAIVMMSGSNSFFVDQPDSGNLFSEFIGSELTAFTRRLFPLSPERGDTLIGGMSMGGYGSFYNALKHSRVFGHAIALGGAVTMKRLLGEETDPGEKARRLRFVESVFGDAAKLPDSFMNPETAAKTLLESGEPLPGVYLACGRDDPYAGDNRAFHDYLTEIGFPHVYEEGPGGHEWAFWREYMDRGLARALGAAGRSDGGTCTEGGI